MWGHNLLVVGLSAILVSGLAYRYQWPIRFQQWMGKRWRVFALNGEAACIPVCTGGWRLWTTVGLLAAYSHLLSDVLFSAGRDKHVWGVPLGWPFSPFAMAYPLVLWGDIGVTLLFVAGMFAMFRWRPATRTIAASVLAMVIGYIAVRGCLLNSAAFGRFENSTTSRSEPDGLRPR